MKKKTVKPKGPPTAAGSKKSKPLNRWKFPDIEKWAFGKKSTSRKRKASTPTLEQVIARVKKSFDKTRKQINRIEKKVLNAFRAKHS